jgi:hypothetical protein
MTKSGSRHHRTRVENGASSRRERIRTDRRPTRRHGAYRNLAVTDDWPRLVPATAPEKSIVEAVVNGNTWIPGNDEPEK